MADLDLRSFGDKLRAAGIAPQHVRRTMAELDDHYHDLLDTLTRDGRGRHAARREARRALGDLDDIAAAVAARRDLKCWYLRCPRLASVIYPLAWVMVLPLVPLIAGAQHAPAIARWGACLLLSAGFTASLLLVLQLTISL